MGGIQDMGVGRVLKLAGRKKKKGFEMNPEIKEHTGVELSDNGVKRTGATLAAARTAAGLELADVARETRVPLRHLRALEADKHEDLPALPYAIGFVKSYARAVGLDPEAIAGHFRNETSKSPHVPTPMTLEQLDERRLPSRTLVIASVGVVVLVIAGLSAWGAGAFDPARPEQTPAIETTLDTAPAPVGNDTAAAPTATVAGSGVAIPGTTQPVGGAAGPVVLTAREDVWVKIYDRASKVSTKIGILKAGESFAVPADPPGLLLWTGKAGALDVTVGGRAVPPLGGPVDTVRDVSLAAADLLARPVAPAAAAAGGPTPIATVPGA